MAAGAAAATSPPRAVCWADLAADDDEGTEDAEDVGSCCGESDQESVANGFTSLVAFQPPAGCTIGGGDAEVFASQLAKVLAAMEEAVCS